MLRHPARDRATGVIRLQDDTASPTLAAYLSQPFEANATIKLAVLIVHGAGRDAKPSFDSALQMVAIGNVPKEEVLVIAPQFLNQYDNATNSDGSKALYWHGIDWIFSEKALNGPVSTYGAIDRIVALLSDRNRFPALQRIMIVGHSAGGQLVQRYAMVGRATDALGHSGLDLRYIVANPSSFVYPVAWRPRPEIVKGCPLYDKWRYGMGDIPANVSERSKDALVRSYLKLNITYLNGTADNDPNNPFLDRGCEAETQGVSRLDRGQRFFAMLSKRFGRPSRQKICYVPGVAHEETKMLVSECSIKASFGGLRAR